MLAIDHVVEVTALLVPEPGVERIARADSCFVHLWRKRVALLAQPPGEERERVVPERVDLYRLAAARRHHPPVDLRVHPGQLNVLLSLPQKAVGWIDADSESRALHVALEDGLELRHQLPQRSAIVGRVEIA